MTPRAIEHRAFRNSAVGALAFALNLGISLLLVPVLLGNWGAEGYGAWLALMAAYALLQTLDLGHQNYVGNELNIQYHSAHDRFRHTLASSLRVAYFLGSLELIVALIVIASGALPSALSATPELISEQYLSEGLVILLCAWAILGSPGGLIVRILVPAGLYFESQWFGVLMRVSQAAAVILAAVLGGGLFSAALAFGISQTTVGLLSLAYVKRRLPAYYPWWRGGHWRTGWEGLRRSLALTANGVIQQLANSGIVVLVAAAFTAASVPTFTTLRTVANTALAVTTILISSILPDVVRFHATRDPQKLDGALDSHWLLSGLLVNGGIVLLLPFLEPLYAIWTRGKVSFDGSLLLCLLASTSLVNFGSGLNAYLSSINDLRSQFLVATTRVVVLLVVTVAFGNSLGIVSVGVGSAVAEIGASVILPLAFARRRLGEMGLALPLRNWRLALVPPAAFILVSFTTHVSGVGLAWIAACFLPFVCVTYLLHWRRIDHNVRARLWSLLRAPARTRRA
jgi:O-antigen/teichoic acid export membrane protein